MPGNYYGYSAQPQDFSFIATAGREIGEGVQKYQQAKQQENIENYNIKQIKDAYENQLIPDAIKRYNEATGNTDPIKALSFVKRHFMEPAKGEKPTEFITRITTAETNFNKNLESVKAEYQRQQVGEASQRAMASKPEVQGVVNPEADTTMASIPTSQASKIGAGPRMFDVPPEPPVEAPKTYEEYESKFSKELPTNIPEEAVKGSGLHQAAARALTSQEDELAAERLKLAREKEARLLEQKSKSNETQAWKAKIAEDRLSFDKLKLAVESGQKNEILSSQAAVLKAQYVGDLAKAEGRWKELEAKLKILSDPSKADKAMMMEMNNESVEQIQGNMAKLSPVIAQMKENQKMADKLVTDLTTGGSVYERTTGAKKTKEKRTTSLAAPKTTPPPATGLPKFNSPSDPAFKALPSGSKFIDGNGVTRTKK